ncbi:MDR family MFS transporter [Corynebacterium cystitidis]|uniref:MDR family MFS transporter n=1 Tax=Corynebacterium cystitidis TaxID=35757 RepID=UPI0027B9EDF0|nr:MDR family MFS transporter [Corynebacterium cystitidis]
MPILCSVPPPSGLALSPDRQEQGVELATTPTTTSESAQAQPNVWLIFTALVTTMLMSSLGQMIFSTALPTIVGELGGVDQMSWVITSFMVTMTIAMPIFGKVGDTLGRKWLYMSGITFFVIGSTVGGFAESMETLIIGRAIQGFGGGGMMVTSQAIVAEVVPARQRGKYMGILGAVFGLSSVLGPVLGGWFTDGPGWRWGMWMNISLGIAALTVCFFALKLRTGSAGGKHFDWLGTLLMSTATSTLILFTTWGGNDYAWNSPMILTLVAISLACWIGFIVVELRVADPLIPLALFRNRNMSLTTIAGVVLGLAMTGTLAYMPTYLQMVHSLSPSAAGLMMIPMMLGMLGTSTAVGFVIAHTGSYKIFPIIGLGLAALALFLMSSMTPATPPWRIGVYFFVFGFGLGLVMQVLVLIVQNSFPLSVVGTATAANNFFRQIGSSLGSSLIGSLFTMNLAGQLNRNIPPAIADLGESGAPYADRWAQGSDFVNSLTPGLVAKLPDTLRNAIHLSYNDGLTPILLMLVPALVVSLLLMFPIREDTLKETIE